MSETTETEVAVKIQIPKVDSQFGITSNKVGMTTDKAKNIFTVLDDDVKREQLIHTIEQAEDKQQACANLFTEIKENYKDEEIDDIMCHIAWILLKKNTTKDNTDTMKELILYTYRHNKTAHRFRPYPKKEYKNNILFVKKWPKKENAPKGAKENGERKIINISNPSISITKEGEQIIKDDKYFYMISRKEDTGSLYTNIGGNKINFDDLV